EVGDLDRVVEDVLAVGCPVVEPAQQLHQRVVQPVDAGLHHRPFALRLDLGLDLFAGLFDHLFDAGGVDAAVGDQLLQRNPGDFPPDGVKAGKGDGLGSVVDDQVDAGQRLEGADVAALPA